MKEYKTPPSVIPGLDVEGNPMPENTEPKRCPCCGAELAEGQFYIDPYSRVSIRPDPLRDAAEGVTSWMFDDRMKDDNVYLEIPKSFLIRLRAALDHPAPGEGETR